MGNLLSNVFIPYSGTGDFSAGWLQAITRLGRADSGRVWWIVQGR